MHFGLGSRKEKMPHHTLQDKGSGQQSCAGGVCFQHFPDSRSREDEPQVLGLLLGCHVLAPVRFLSCSMRAKHDNLVESTSGALGPRKRKTHENWQEGPQADRSHITEYFTEYCESLK